MAPTPGLSYLRTANPLSERYSAIGVYGDVCESPDQRRRAQKRLRQGMAPHPQREQLVER